MVRAALTGAVRCFPVTVLSPNVAEYVSSGSLQADLLHKLKVRTDRRNITMFNLSDGMCRAPLPC